jgi:hypothetical protein
VDRSASYLQRIERHCRESAEGSGPSLDGESRLGEQSFNANGHNGDTDSEGDDAK